MRIAFVIGIGIALVASGTAMMSSVLQEEGHSFLQLFPGGLFIAFGAMILGGILDHILKTLKILWEQHHIPPSKTESAKESDK